MRCCKICGCYLPDGRTACLACGFDEEPCRHVNTRPDYTSASIALQSAPCREDKRAIRNAINRIQQLLVARGSEIEYLDVRKNELNNSVELRIIGELSPDAARALDYNKFKYNSQTNCYSISIGDFFSFT